MGLKYIKVSRHFEFTLSEISDFSCLWRGLELGLGVGFLRNRHIRSTIHLSRRVWHLCIPMTESTVGHPSSCRIRRYRSLDRLVWRLCTFSSWQPRVPYRYRSLLC